MKIGIRQLHRMRINSVSFVRIGYSHSRTFHMGVNEFLFASVQ